MAIKLGGGGGSASFPTIFLSKSQTWVPPQDGNICIHVIGAGGSGAVGGTPYLSGGAAGGYCKKNSLAVTTSGSFTIVVGSGGSAVQSSSSDTNGNHGGNSTVAGTGLSATLTANGGQRGIAGTSANSGGTASNGDVNNTGGGSQRGRGGGAVGLTGSGNLGSETTTDINTYGGDCDVIGDFWSSTMGQLAGGTGGIGVTYDYGNRAFNSASINGGPLAGGGNIRQTVASTLASTTAGNGGIGAGGGAASSTSQSLYCRSGHGGEGIVVIQYIP